MIKFMISRQNTDEIAIIIHEGIINPNILDHDSSIVKIIVETIYTTRLMNTDIIIEKKNR